MKILGHIQNGVVVLEGSRTFPEGTPVFVSPTPRHRPESLPPETEMVLEPGKLPYVHAGIPGTWTLTNATIAQIFRRGRRRDDERYVECTFLTSTSGDGV